MAEPATPAWTRGNRIVGVDPELRRLWVGGQRLHHGATGIALAGARLASLLDPAQPARALAYLLAGGADGRPRLEGPRRLVPPRRAGRLGLTVSVSPGFSTSTFD